MSSDVNYIKWSGSNSKSKNGEKRAQTQLSGQASLLVMTRRMVASWSCKLHFLEDFADCRWTEMHRRAGRRSMRPGSSIDPRRLSAMVGRA